MKPITQFGALVLAVSCGLLYQWLHVPVHLTNSGRAHGPEDVARWREDEREAMQARNILRAYGCSAQYTPKILKHAHAVHLSAPVVAATIVTESSCRPAVHSKAGAIGLLQVNERVWKTGQNLEDPETNIRIGTKILASYVKKYGLREGLHHYNGMGDRTNKYADKVLKIARVNGR